jgi:hypothetical protein
MIRLVCGRCMQPAGELFVASCKLYSQHWSPDYARIRASYKCPCGASLVCGLPHPRLCFQCLEIAAQKQGFAPPKKR